MLSVSASLNLNLLRRLKSKISVEGSICIVTSQVLFGCALTLKQTQKEKGMVTTTSSQQRAVRIHPQIPIPVSLSSAAGANETRLGKSIKNSDVNSSDDAQRILIFKNNDVNPVM
jgi:hypothetical protein